jgi:hypothetical protein
MEQNATEPLPTFRPGNSAVIVVAPDERAVTSPFGVTLTGSDGEVATHRTSSIALCTSAESTTGDL